MEENNSNDIVKGAILNIIEDLTILSRSLEKWPVFTIAEYDGDEEVIKNEKKQYQYDINKYQKRIFDHLKRLFRKIKYFQSNCEKNYDFNLPLGLIDTVDNLITPDLWLHYLTKYVQDLNNNTRGELISLRKIRKVIDHYIDILNNGRKNKDSAMHVNFTQMIGNNNFYSSYQSPVILNRKKLEIDYRNIIKLLPSAKILDYGL